MVLADLEINQLYEKFTSEAKRITEKTVSITKNLKIKGLEKQDQKAYIGKEEMQYYLK